MWRASEHEDLENLRWAWLRGVEWQAWPMFMSQPIVPLLLLFFPWYYVIPAVFVVAVFWRVAIASTTVSMIVDLGPIFVLSKFLVCPVSAYLLWSAHHHWIAIVALTWPWVGTYIGLFALGLAEIFPNRDASQIGVIQDRMLRLLGYSDPAITTLKIIAKVEAG